MRVTVRRRTAAVAALATATSLVLAATGSAPASAGTYSAQVGDVGLVNPRAMVQAAGKLFVSDGNAVRVLSETGAALATITGVFGAGGMALSADRATLYVAESGSTKIAVIDVASATKSSEFTGLGGCPGDLAVAGTALFYGFGCDAGTAAISHVDLTTGTPADSTTPDASGYYGPPRLAGSSGRLWAVDVASTPANLTTWPVTGTALGTPVVSAQRYSISDMAPHGSDLAIAEPGAGLFRVLDATLSSTATYPAEAYPTTAVWSADGSHLVGGLDAVYGDGIYVYDAVAGTTILKALIPGVAQVSGQPGVVSRTLTLSSDESTVLAIGHQFDNSGDHYYLVRSTTRTPLTSSVTVAATTPARYGLPSTITVRTPGRPGAHVVLSVTSDGTTRTRALVTNASGVAVTAWTSAYSAVVRATVLGDLTHESAASSTVGFKVPARVLVALARGYKVRGGVTYYHKPPQAMTHVQVSPLAYGRRVSFTLQGRAGKRWVTLQRGTFYLTTAGTSGTYMKAARKGIVFRVLWSFAGDGWNTAGSAATAPYTVG